MIKSTIFFLLLFTVPHLYSDNFEKPATCRLHSSDLEKVLQEIGPGLSEKAILAIEKEIAALKEAEDPTASLLEPMAHCDLTTLK